MLHQNMHSAFSGPVKSTIRITRPMCHIAENYRKFVDIVLMLIRVLLLSKNESRLINFNKAMQTFFEVVSFQLSNIKRYKVILNSIYKELTAMIMLMINHTTK
jgi:hypothetical protein